MRGIKLHLLKGRTSKNLWMYFQITTASNIYIAASLYQAPSEALKTMSNSTEYLSRTLAIHVNGSVWRHFSSPLFLPSAVISLLIECVLCQTVQRREMLCMECLVEDTPHLPFSTRYFLIINITYTLRYAPYCVLRNI